jgi:hypothetical protein
MSYKQSAIDQLTIKITRTSLINYTNEIYKDIDPLLVFMGNHQNNYSNPHNVTKAQVGLSNVDNTSDLNKPISTATQDALDELESVITGGVDISSKADVTGETFTGNLSISTGDAEPSLTLESNVGVSRALYGRTGANARWRVYLGSADAESGANVGSDFSISRFDDSGAFVDTPFIITRSNGIVTARNLNADNTRIVGVADPVSPTDAANRQWVLANGGGGSVPDGGTTGQALVKTSSTDGAVAWVTVGTLAIGTAQPTGGELLWLDTDESITNSTVFVGPDTPATINQLWVDTDAN